MYIIAACLPRLRPIIILLHTRLSASFSSLLERYYESHDPSQSPTAEHQGLRSKKQRLAPRIDVKLTGQGNLDSSATMKGREELVNESS